MPIYITQGRYTRTPSKHDHQAGGPADPLARLLSKVGGKLIGYYLTFGEYDFLSIAEFPTTPRWRRCCWRPAAVAASPISKPPSP